LASFYRFYLLRDDHIMRRREDYFADDATAMAAAKYIIGDFPGVEIWCEQRKVITLTREEAAHLPPAAPRAPPRAALLISRNRRLLQRAAETCRRTEALCARVRRRASILGGWSPPHGSTRRRPTKHNAQSATKTWISFDRGRGRTVSRPPLRRG
jgi:hypothetical protein